MKKLLTILTVLAFTVPAMAQKVTCTFDNVSISDALRQLNEQSADYTIHFLFDELEDFRVTTSIKNKRLPEAIQQMIGFYPIRLTVATDDAPEVQGKQKQQLYVECTHKTARNLTGTLVDEQGQPVAYANVAVLNPADSTLLGGGVSNESGYFAVPSEQPTVLARISYVGYKTIYKICEQPEVGTIRMQRDALMLKNVNVKGYRPTMKMISGGMEIDVQNTLLAEAGNALDVLSEIPRVNVTANGSVEVFGKGKPEIYINGKKMSSKNELEQLTSKDIKSVEVITAPGAHYNAEVSAVIRINTIKRLGDFLSLYAVSRVRYFREPSGTGGFSVTYRKNGFELDIYPYYSNSVYSENNDFVSTLHMADYDVQTRQHGDFLERMQTFLPQAKVSYDFDASHSIGASLYLNVPMKYKGDFLSDYSVWRSGKQEGTVSQSCPHDWKVTHQDVSAYYLGQVGMWNLQVDGSFIHTEVNRGQHITETSTDLGNRTVNTSSTQNSRLYAGKAVAERKFQRGELSIGTELTHSHVDADNHNPEGYIKESDNLIKESNYAGFASYNLSLGHWNLTAGLRYEHVVYDFYDYGILDTDISRRYDDIFPSVSAAWNKGKWGLQLSYSKKTRRPSYGQLRSYQQYDNRYAYEGGNPELLPTVNHEVELMGMWKWISLSLDYTYLHDYMLWRSSLYDDQEVAYANWINIDHKQELSAALVLQPKFGWYRPQLTAAYSQQFFDARRYGFQTSLRHPHLGLNLQNRFVVSKTLWFSLQGYIVSAYDGGTQELKPKSSINITAHKGFFDDRLSVNLYISDLFDGQRERWMIRTQEVEVSKDCNNYTQGVQLQLTYRLNTTRSKYKGTGAGNAEKNRLSN